MIHEINTGDTAWVLASAGLVLLMTPGLAFFYGGMVRAKGALNMIMMSFISMGTVGVLWVLFGYSMSFGDSLGGVIGNPLQFAGLTSLMSPDAVVATVPALAFVAFQAAFAIIAVALVSGSVADRTSFKAWTLFTVLWSVFVYFPAAHWVFAFDGLGAEHGGWIANTVKAIDFAGGTAIHINAGAAGLALAIVLGRRIDFLAKPMRPHNMTLVMLGAGLLWFGWFGFNAGSALGAGTTAAVAWVNTLAAPAAAMLAWLVVEQVRDGHPTSLGAASGLVAGLVAVTPAAGSVSPLGALAIGALAGVGCAFAIGIKTRLRLDDSLDVVGVHLVGGLLGTLAIGLFADPGTPAKTAGLFYGGGLDQLGRQALGALSVLAYSFVVTLLLGVIIKVTVGFRVSKADENSGIDLAEHSEIGYDLSPVYYSSFDGVRRTLLVEPGSLPSHVLAHVEAIRAASPSSPTDLDHASATKERSA
ncbi:ammonium transporter [Propioniciclava tarda]|uniref:ammonium transporter n=1 Tax=Propioniciclava tarda TaxID=433330 RepID=UPI001173B906|nr:ammonium transporter [Propioniciclava tarda]SMO52495.1 ammonium transporter, Amt family [Propioniciclava tarda]HOA89677.1 ammonium transporter [Propioniciclava tarda]HQA31258.1 ammonium transporter [Propioniciclava tarda]HQD60822.1 ammonium transporter [Propioniciclava tarda]